MINCGPKDSRPINNKCFTCLSGVRDWCVHPIPHPQEATKTITCKKKQKAEQQKCCLRLQTLVYCVPRHQTELKLRLTSRSRVSSSISRACSLSGGTSVSLQPELSQQSRQRSAELTVQDWLRRLQDRDTLFTSNICPSETEAAWDKKSLYSTCASTFSSGLMEDMRDHYFLLGLQTTNNYFHHYLPPRWLWFWLGLSVCWCASLSAGLRKNYYFYKTRWKGAEWAKEEPIQSRNGYKITGRIQELFFTLVNIAR